MSGSAGREDGEDIAHKVERNSSTGVRKENALITQRSSRKSFAPGEQDNELDARARTMYQGMSGSTQTGFPRGALHGVLFGEWWRGTRFFPSVNHQPLRARTWLCSPAPREGLTYFILCWSRAGGRGAVASPCYLGTDRFSPDKSVSCQVLCRWCPGLCARLGLLSWSRQHGSMPSRPRALPRLRALQRWLIPSLVRKSLRWDVGVPCCLRATCSLHAACQAPVSRSPASLLLAG